MRSNPSWGPIFKALIPFETVLSLSSEIRGLAEIVNRGGFYNDHGLFVDGVFFAICVKAARHRLFTA